AVRPKHQSDEPLPEGHYEPPADLNETLTTLLRSPNICSKRWVYEQYDHMVQTDNALWPGGEAAVIRIKGRSQGVALTTDGNGRYCYLDPRRGGRAVVAEAARNLSCVGARPIAITNCLNFGNPEKGEIFYQFKEAVEGMAEACEALGTPVTGGNVSFYNESFGQAIYPNPVVGMVGLIEDVSLIMTPGFRDEGDAVVLLGNARPALDGSECQKVIFGETAGRIPDVDLELEKKLQLLVREAILEGLVKSAHDVSAGGLACCLAESAIMGGTGAIIDLKPGPRPDILLFGEAPGLIVVTVAERDLEGFAQLALDLPTEIIGRVGGKRLTISAGGPDLVDVPV
ncbi:MAG: AIR synthase related protein, partial [Actinomycetota bacterium]